jgi:hypothetical protein
MKKNFIMLSTTFYNYIQKLTTVIFWAVVQRVVVIPYRRLGRRWDPIGCPETSVRNLQYSLRNDPEYRNSDILRGGRLKPRILKM